MCKTVVNVGWPHKLVGVNLSRHHRPPIINKINLAEIDISKACTGALMNIKSIPVFNELDLWQSYNAKEPTNSLNLYIVDANFLDLFRNRRHNL